MRTATRAVHGERATSISTLAALGAACLVGAALAAAPLAGQDAREDGRGHPAMSGPEVLFGPEGPRAAPLTRPGFGPAGTLVELQTNGLPSNHPIQIMIGAMQQGFEVVAETVTDENGRVRGASAISVASPEWLETDRAYLVIVSDRDYEPLDRAAFFHPTTENGTLTRAGTIASHGARCTLLLNDEGRYVLVGDAGAFADGTEVVVTGTAELAEDCGDGLAIRVREVRTRGGVGGPTR